MGWLVQRLPIAKLLSACIMCWGAVLACTAVSPPPLPPNPFRLDN